MTGTTERGPADGPRGPERATAPDRYVHPLAERYASREMQALFSPARRYGTWRRLWLALAEAERELGLPIPEEAVRAMRDHLDDVDLTRAAEYEARFRHDVVAHIHLFGDAAPEARGIIHLGATSAFVTDNADLILHREALRLVRRRLLRTIRALADFARRHRDLPTLAYTHLQPAQPTTVGKRAALWLQDFVLDVEELEFRLSTLRFRGVRGTTGTQASFLELFRGDGTKVERLERLVAAKMGFEAGYPVTGQTYPRKVDQGILATLAGIGASASKFAHDVRLLQHLGEVEEPFGEEQVGSSAMPYKRNPVRSERICALARHLIALSQGPAVTAATQWLERSLDDSAIRRIALPDGYLAADGILLLAAGVASGLVVHEGVIRRNLGARLPFLATEAVLVRAAARGGDRQELHERIRRHALAARERMREEGENDLLDRLAGDPAFGMDRGELESLLDPARFVGRAPVQVEGFLRDVVEPLLDRHRGELEAEVGEAPRV